MSSIIEIFIWLVGFAIIIGMGFLLGLKVAFDRFIKTSEGILQDEPKRQIGFGAQFDNKSIQPVASTDEAKER